MKFGMFEFKYLVCFNNTPIAAFHELEEAEWYLEKNLIANRIVEIKE